MELERDRLVSPIQEVPVIEGELVATIRELAGRGVGSKTIARTVGVARNTVRRYLRGSIAPGVQVHPAARRLTDAARKEARVLYEGPAGGNAVVVQRLLKERGTDVSVRTIERAVVDIRRAHRAAALATVRVESAPGDQLQIDFGQKRVRIGDEWPSQSHPDDPGRELSIAAKEKSGITWQCGETLKKPAVDAAGAVDAQNAPTAPWKTAQNAVSHSAHSPHHRQSGGGQF